MNTDTALEPRNLSLLSKRNEYDKFEARNCCRWPVVSRFSAFQILPPTEGRERAKKKGIRGQEEFVPGGKAEVAAMGKEVWRSESKTNDCSVAGYEIKNRVEGGIRC
jgi:hypothetical protein